MAAELRPKKKPHVDEPVVLFVEGPTDGWFIYRLLSDMNLKRTIWINDIEGETNFGSAVTALMQSVPVSRGVMRTLAIMRDADTDPQQSFIDVQRVFEGDGLIAPDTVSSVSDPNKDGIRTAAYIMPRAQSPGYIEDLFIEALIDLNDPIISCLRDLEAEFLRCMDDNASPLKPTQVTKNLFNRFLVTVEEELPTQAAYEYMYDTSWFPWMSAKFDDIRSFLTLLAQSLEET